MIYVRILILVICRSTEHDHVKDNLPAKLLRIRTFGKMKLEEFKELISASDYNSCLAKMDKTPTWYPLTLDVFVKFLYKVIYPSISFIFQKYTIPNFLVFLMFLIFLVLLMFLIFLLFDSEGDFECCGCSRKAIS